MTLIEMMKRNVDLYPQKTALIYKDLEVSYEMLYEKSNTLSIFLIGIGLKKGERVGLLMHKTPEVIVSFLGVTSAGGVVLPIDYNQTISHIQFLLNLTDPCALIVSESFQPLFSRLKVPSFENNIIVIGQKAKKHYHSWNDIMAGNSHDLPGVDIQGELEYIISGRGHGINP
jgi:acyl-CoA synthetase (AMP-forming)/AMP-acid ligase II